MSSDNTNFFTKEKNNEEKRSKKLLVQFERNYPKVANTENVNTILENLKHKKENKL